MLLVQIILEELATLALEPILSALANWAERRRLQREGRRGAAEAGGRIAVTAPGSSDGSKGAALAVPEE